MAGQPQSECAGLVVFASHECDNTADGNAAAAVVLLANWTELESERRKATMSLKLQGLIAGIGKISVIYDSGFSDQGVYQKEFVSVRVMKF